MSTRKKSGEGKGSDGSGNGSAATRFKPGQSGNPKGRPKGSKNLATLAAEALDEQIQILDKGRERSMTKREFMVQSIVSHAMKGSPKHVKTLLEITGEGALEPPQSGVLVVPVRSTTLEDWEALHGRAAQGMPPPDDIEGYLDDIRKRNAEKAL
jgi:hypothetical protein